MIDTNSPLEVRFSGHVYPVESVQAQGSELITTYNRGNSIYAFHAKTGVLVGHEGVDSPYRIQPASGTSAVTHFKVKAGNEDWAHGYWLCLRSEAVFDDPKLCAERVNLLNKQARESASKARFKVEKTDEIVTNTPYQKWAEARTASGEWTVPDFVNEAWFKENAPEYHFPRLSKETQASIVYWSTVGDACHDNSTTLSIGRYLNRFFAGVLTNEQIRDIVVAVDPPLDLHLALTEDEIYKVYRSGPHSCMAYVDGSDNFYGRPNPIRVLAAGDLAVAYIKRGEAIIGRAIVWPEKKAAHRRYGDIERMEIALGAAGYTLDAAGSGVDDTGSGLFEGARLLKRQVSGGYSMPYLDYGYGVDDDGDFFTLCMNAEYYPRETDGALNTGNAARCDSCGDHEDEEDLSSVGDEQYCQRCYDHYTSNCSYCDEVFHDRGYYNVGESQYCSSTCRTNGANQCESCDSYVEYSLTEVVTAQQCTQHWCNSCTADDSSVCQNCHSHTVDIFSVHDGATGEAMLEVCDDCDVDAEFVTTIDGVSYLNSTLTKNADGELVRPEQEPV